MTTTKNYAQLQQELDKILVELQSNDLGIDDAVIQYEKGMELVAQLESHLKQAENTILKVKQKFDT